jgi:NAD(P)-dependent dehydrogenase (short-subunit alcohol dehydrogenase family)
MGRISGKVALVTGGGTGIGRGVAQALAAEGARVAVSGRRREPLVQTVRFIQQAGGEALAVQADVSREEDVERLVGKVVQVFGRIDILVNNAGIGGGAPVQDQELQEWDMVLAVNLRGPFLLARAVLPLMRAQGGGDIVNISSESGLEHYPGDGIYGISKHALNALSEYIQRDNQSAWVRVSTVCPGMVVSEMTENSPGLDHNKCLYPEDIAELVVWLVTRRPNIKIGTPILIQTMQNPWE